MSNYNQRLKRLKELQNGRYLKVNKGALWRTAVFGAVTMILAIGVAVWVDNFMIRPLLH